MAHLTGFLSCLVIWLSIVLGIRLFFCLFIHIVIFLLLFILLFLYGASHSSNLGFYLFVGPQEFWAVGLDFPFRLEDIGVDCRHSNTTSTTVRSWQCVAHTCCKTPHCTRLHIMISETTTIKQSISDAKLESEVTPIVPHNIQIQTRPDLDS